MSRVTFATDNNDILEVCDRCVYILDGVRNCGYCGEPKCPVCGCLCPGTAKWNQDEWREDHS